ncbi:MAG: hypothetical protein WBZ36_05345 [Candidatus Nitrosopolaris sp.]|jgi:hypothetical protein
MKSKLNPPISKKCRICKEEKLLCEFEFSDKAKDKRVSTCKNCVGKKDEQEPDYGACCQYHLVVTNTYNQLDLLLQVIETLQCNKVEIPRELLAKMFRIVYKGGPMSL